MNIVLLGAPASGKGTLGSDLSSALNLPHISSGNIIRQNIADKTEIGLKVKDLINRGCLVDDKTMNKMIIARLGQDDCKNGFILDGYPRTLSQAITLDKYFNIDYAINIDVLEDIAIKRISGRRVCNYCNKTYHTSRLASENCPICNNPLVIRSDDKVDIIKNRYNEFVEQSNSLLKFYNEKNVLFTVDGNGTSDNTTKLVLNLLKV